MDYILNRIEQRIGNSPAEQELGVSVDLHQEWFLYVIVLYLAILYNSNQKKLAEDRVGFLCQLQKPAFGTLIALSVLLGMGKNGKSFQKSLVSRLGRFVELRNAEIGHGFSNSNGDLQKILDKLKYHKAQIQLDVKSGLENGIESYLGNSCDIICVTSCANGLLEGLCYKIGEENPITWKSPIGENYRVGETYLSTVMNGECNVIRLSPFIHIDPKTNSIYVFRSIKDRKEKLGQTIYYKILESDDKEFNLSWKEFCFERPENSRNSSSYVVENIPEHEIIVDSNGRGNVTTIAEALSIAGDRTKIIVKPGNYHEHVVIMKQVHICGESDEMGFPIIWGDVDGESVCIELNAAAQLKNLRFTNGKCERACKAIVGNADATLENIEIFKWNGDGIVVHGSPFIRNCTLHDIDGGGILIEPWFSNPQIKDCKFYDLEKGGVISNSTDGIVENCEFYNCSMMDFLGGAITLKANSILSIRNSNFHDNSCCVFIEKGSSITVSKCTFKNSIHMVDAYDKTKNIFTDCKFIGASDRTVDFKCCEGKFTNCEFSGCLGHSVFNGESSNPTFENCKFHNNKCQSVVLDKKSLGHLLECKFYANEDVSICVLHDSKPEIDNCSIYDTSSFGLVFVGAQGLVKECELFECRGPAIRIEKDSSPTIENCFIRNNSSIGLWITEESKPLISHCDFSGNKGISVQVEEKSSPTIKSCKIHDNVSNGMYFSESIGTVECCDFFFSTTVALVIMKKANPIVLNCLFHENYDAGLYISDAGMGIIDNCKFYKNKNTMVGVDNGANSCFKNCDFYDAEVPCLVFRNCGGIVEQCKFHDSIGGITLLESANPSILKSEFYKIKNYAILFKDESLGYLEDCSFKFNGGESDSPEKELFCEDCYRELSFDIADSANPVILNCHGIYVDDRKEKKYETVMFGRDEWMLEDFFTGEPCLSWWNADNAVPVGWSLPTIKDVRYLEKYLAEHLLQNNSTRLTLDQALRIKGEFWTEDEKNLLLAIKMKVETGGAPTQYQSTLKLKKLPIRLIRYRLLYDI